METKRSITRFILKALPFVALPPTLLIVLYVVLDPFGALRRNDGFYDTDYRYNRGMVSVRTLKGNLAEGREYNTFIIGSSLSLYYPAEYLESKIGDAASAIHYDSSAQTISVLRRSIEYLDNRGLPIDNAIIVLAANSFSWKEDYNTLPYIVPAEWRTESLFPELTFQIDMMKHFFDRQFLRVYLPWLFYGSEIGVEGKINIDEETVNYSKKYNEPQYLEAEKIISYAPENFYGHKPQILHNISDSSRLDNALDGGNKSDLLRIKEIFDRHHTDYRIVISPNYDVTDISKADEAWMRKTFGDRFFDFVRPFADLAVREDSYYDKFHYRPHIAKLIIDSIYK